MQKMSFMSEEWIYAMKVSDAGGICLTFNLHHRSRSGGHGVINSSDCKWHLDKFFVTINTERHYLWHAVDHEGEGLEREVS